MEINICGASYYLLGLIFGVVLREYLYDTQSRSNMKSGGKDD